MNVAALFMKTLDNKGDAYLPYLFTGNWSKQEIEKVELIIDPRVPERVDAMFNNWQFSKMGDNFYSARRSTWDMGSIGANSLDEFIGKLSQYYDR